MPLDSMQICPECTNMIEYQAWFDEHGESEEWREKSELFRLLWKRYDEEDAGPDDH